MAAAVADDVLTMWHLVNPKLLLEFTGPTIWERLPWALLAFGVAVGGLIVVYIVVKVILAYCCLPRKYHDRLVWSGVDKVTGEDQFIHETRNTSRSYRHVILETLFFIGVFLVLWIASSVAGFNLLSSSLMSIGIGLIATYMFAVVIQNMGAGYWVYVTDKVEEFQYWRSAVNPNIHGLIHEMHPLYVQLQRENDNKDGLLEIQVPMSDLLSGTWIRDFNAEGSARRRMEADEKELREQGLLKNVVDRENDILPMPAGIHPPAGKTSLAGGGGNPFFPGLVPAANRIQRIWRPKRRGVQHSLKQK